MLSEGEASIAPPQLSPEQLMRSPAPHTMPQGEEPRSEQAAESPCPAIWLGRRQMPGLQATLSLGQLPVEHCTPGNRRTCVKTGMENQSVSRTASQELGETQVWGDFSASHSWHSPQVCFHFPETNHGKGRNLRQGFEASQALRE